MDHMNHQRENARYAREECIPSFPQMGMKSVTREGKNKEGKTRGNSYEATSPVRVNAKGKMKGSIVVVNVKTLGVDSWKVKIVSGEGIGRGVLEDPREEARTTCLNLTTNSPPPFLPEKSTNLSSPKEFKCLP
nr:hypothetical protein [Tanacetum cinerariifolium]